GASVWPKTTITPAIPPPGKAKTCSDSHSWKSETNCAASTKITSASTGSLSHAIPWPGNSQNLPPHAPPPSSRNQDTEHFDRKPLSRHPAGVPGHVSNRHPKAPRGAEFVTQEHAKYPAGVQS